MNRPKIAILLPCYNEEETVGKVVRDFAKVMPEATIYVYDNNSTDQTASIAREAGAVVRQERQQGKGHVVRRMFRDIEADFYIMTDGDDTYEASVAPEMLQCAIDGPYDLVNYIRKEVEQEAYRGGHRLGNLLLTGTVRNVFGKRVRDMLSGFKVFSRRFVKSFPALSHGFDIETELAVHALELAMPVTHVEGPYRGRPPGSTSKLRTYRDGWRILMLIIKLVRHERPFLFFGATSLVLALIAICLMIPLIGTYLESGLVPRLPTAMLSMGLICMAFIALITGTILDTVTRGRRELRMLSYLQYPVFPSTIKDAPLQTLAASDFSQKT